MNPELITNESQNKNPSEKRITPLPQPQSTPVCKIIKEKEIKKIKSTPKQCESNDEEEEEDDIPNFVSPEESKYFDNSDSDLNNESILDPETGLLLDTSSNTETSPLSTIPSSSSKQSSEKVVVSSTEDITSQYTNTIQYVSKSEKLQIPLTHMSLRNSIIQENSSTMDFHSRIEYISIMESELEENGNLHQIRFLCS